MPQHISALQLYNLQHIISGDIPLTARRMAGIADWTDHYRRMSMCTTSLDRNNLIRNTERAVGAWQSRQTALEYADRQSRLVGADAVAQKEHRELEKSAVTTNLYFKALEDKDYALAQQLSALDVNLRRHWNARVQDRQQTYLVKQMLGEDATTTYMTQDERTLFYNRFVKGNKNEADRKYNEYLIYMYLYGCAVHAILNSFLHAKGQSLTDAQYESFLQAVYDNASDIFTDSDFGKSFEIKNGVIPLHSGKNIILQNNIKAAKQIRDILHNNLKIDMSDVYISDKEIPDGYAVIAEGAGNNTHKVAIDTVTKAWFDSLKGRNTSPAEDQKRLWIGTVTGGGQ